MWELDFPKVPPKEVRKGGSFVQCPCPCPCLLRSATSCPDNMMVVVDDKIEPFGPRFRQLLLETNVRGKVEATSTSHGQ
ncbi:hypothetical protein SLA2020_287830 [Shorea laevis]